MNSDGNELEIWSAGNGDCFVYTESWDFAKELKRQFSMATYFGRNGKAFAWQFRVPRRMITLLKSRFETLMKSEEEKTEKTSVEFQ